jgi:hypothetical protein
MDIVVILLLVHLGSKPSGFPPDFPISTQEILTVSGAPQFCLLVYKP